MFVLLEGKTKGYNLVVSVLSRFASFLVLTVLSAVVMECLLHLLTSMLFHPTMYVRCKSMCYLPLVKQALFLTSVAMFIDVSLYLLTFEWPKSQDVLHFFLSLSPICALDYLLSRHF